MTDEAYRAKRILTDFRRLNRIVMEKWERLHDLMDSATRTTPSMSGERVGGSGDQSRIETAMITKLDLERQLDASIDRLNATRYRIQDAIDAVDDLDQRTLLDLRYIDGKRWIYVMDALHISEPTSHRIHRAALEAFMAQYERLEKEQQEKTS